MRDGKKLGRPALAPGARKDKLVHLLMMPDERKYLAELAQRNGRYLSEEIMRRLRASFANEGLFEDAADLWRANNRIAERVLLSAGWVATTDPRYGNVKILVGPGGVFVGPFISDEEASQPLPATTALSTEVARRARNAARELGLPPTSAAHDDLVAVMKKHARKTAQKEMPKKERRKEKSAA
jgi:hypothetical protein